VASWERRRASFFADSEQLLSDAAELESVGAEQAAVRVRWQAASEKLRGCVQEWQVARAEQRKVEEQRDLEANRRAAQEEERQREAELRRRADESEALSTFQLQRAEAGAAAQAAAEATARRAAAETAARVRRGRPAVAARQAVAQDQVVQRQEARARAEAAAAERRRRLDESVHHPSAPADPARTVGPTESSRAQPEAHGAAFRAVHGFTTAQVLSDLRFRALEALGGAGLRGSPACAAAVAALAPVRAARVDTLSSAQRADAAARRGAL
jgi:hypothetical protein